MERGEAGDEGQSDPGARRDGQHVRAAVERLEDGLLELVGDAGSLVLDDEQEVALLDVQPDPDRAAPRRVPHRVQDEVLDDALQLGRVDVGEERGAADADVPALERARRDRALDEREHLGRLPAHRDEPAAEPLHVEQVGEEPLEPPGGSGAGARVARGAGRGVADAEWARAWAAAARTAAAFGLAELAPEIALGLAPEREPWLAAAAREALFALFQRRFADGAAFQAFWREHAGRPRDPFFLAPLEESRARERDYFLRWLASDPGAAAEHLGVADPGARAAVARIVGKAIAAGDLDARLGVAALLEQLAVEDDAEAFDALLAAALDPLLGELPEAASVRALREILADSAAAGMPGTEIATARALAELPWKRAPLEEAGGDSIARGIELVADLAERLPRKGPFFDADVALAVLHALEGLGDALEVREPTQAGQPPAFASGASNGSGAGAPAANGPTQAPAAAPPAERVEVDTGRARAVLGRALADAELDTGVRIAAVGALTPIAEPGDLDGLCAVLADARTSPDLSFALLGSIGRVAARLAPEDPAVPGLVAHLGAGLADPDPDLRKQTLAVLATPSLAPVAAKTEIDRWIARLEVEPVDGIRDGLLALVRDHGRASEVRPLLELESFERLFAGDPVRARELGATLAKLALGAPELEIDAARRLAAAPDPATRTVRLRAALELCARLSDEMAAALPLELHHEVVDWALELARDGFGSQLSLPSLASGGSLLRRLLDVHLARCFAAEGATGACLHARAVFTAELGLYNAAKQGLPTPADRKAVEELFGAALAHANAHPADLAPIDLLRDRARYRDGLGDPRGARLDFLAVLEAEADPPARLELFDLRRAANLCLAPEAGPPDGERAALCSWRLVSSPAWRNEPVATRLADLEAAVERACATGRPEPLERYVAWFDGYAAALASPQPGAPVPPVSTPSAGGWWEGLASSRDDLERLASVVRSTLDSLRTSDGPDGPVEPREPSPGGDTSSTGGSSPASAPRPPTRSEIVLPESVLEIAPEPADRGAKRP